ncbi:hydrolase [Chakrabartyella piscis]|uniref:hydrolase n=1 Tax=Chakrabartyella piscis TaxID=2918914 RepID=UPI00295893B1|nr:hydrolase [Chakrabartyella piscis]
MQKALFSSRNFSLPSNDDMITEFYSCISDLLQNERVQKLDEHVQHCDTSRLQHCINVSYYSFRLSYALGWDYKSATRAGLLHDLYFYDWRTNHKKRSYHADWHPRVALDNARKITSLNKVEQDAILKHMWPCTMVPPRYKESYVVTAVDKMTAIMEISEKLYNRYIWRRVAVSAKV